MNRHRASLTSSDCMVHDQPRIDALNVIVGRIAKVGIRQIRRAGEQCVASFFAHSAIIGRFLASGNSHFPVVVFVHGETVPVAGQENTI